MQISSAVNKRYRPGDEAKSFYLDLAVLTRHPHRLAGFGEGKSDAPGSLPAARYVANRLAPMGLQEVFTQEFPIVQSVTTECELIVNGQTPAILPARANLLQASITPQEGLTGQAIFVAVLMLPGAMYMQLLAERSFMNPAWYPAIALGIFRLFSGRINSAFLTYGLFRVASDIEKLPFPMAPIGAQGIAALAEQQEESQPGRQGQVSNWRWRVFSIGGLLGLSFGFLYTALPIISTALLDEPIIIILIPFVDFTSKTSGMLEAVATGISLNLGQLMIGMVLPFFAVVGSFIGYIVQFVLNPLLYNAGVLTSWEPTDDTVLTMFKNYMDFYFSFTMGLMVAIAIVGLTRVAQCLRKQRKLRIEQEAQGASQADLEVLSIPAGRGDIRLPYAVMGYAGTTICYILLSGWLIDWHPNVMAILVFFGFVYQPLLTYVMVRLEGMAGQMVNIQAVREAAFILSGYNQGVDIWFLPVPYADYGQQTVFWRQAELTGTKFWSIWKAELVLIPIVLIASICFAQFIWSLAEIPGPEYPYAERMWELNAATRCIMYSATLGRYSKFHEAFNWNYLAAGAGAGVVMFGVMAVLNLPTMLIYGLVKGFGALAYPHIFPLQFIGALLGRFYFERKMGLTWRKYIPVIAAGFACGMGLVTIFSIGVNFLAKSVIKIPF